MSKADNLRFSTHIRVSGPFLSRWVWKLVTPDGHVANQSPPFPTREACEADAKRQGLPVEGLSPQTAEGHKVNAACPA